MKKVWARLAILVLSIFTVSGGATAATVPLMMQSFPKVSGTVVELLMTVPSLGIILFTPISNLVADKIGVKKTILTGLILIFVSGVTPALTMNFPLIFASRVILGLGTGLLMSFSQSLIIQMYDGADQQKMLGFSSVFQGLGMFAMTFAAGILLKQGWQMSYWIYLIVFPIILLVAFSIPKNVGHVETDNQAEVSSKKINGKIWLLSLFAFLFNGTFAFISIKFTLLVVSKHYGTATDASTLLGIMAFAMVAGGFLFMFIQKNFSRFSMAIGLGFATTAFILLASSRSLIVSALGVAILGMSVSIFMASMVTNINVMTSAKQVAFSTSIAMTCANVGTLLAPYYAQTIGKLFNNMTPEFSFEAGTVVFAILFVITIIAGVNYDKLAYQITKNEKNDVEKV